MVQEIIVYLIGFAVVVYIGVAVYRLIEGRRDPCSGCAGCGLRSELLQTSSTKGGGNGKLRGRDLRRARKILAQERKSCKGSFTDNPSRGCGCGCS